MDARQFLHVSPEEVQVDAGELRSLPNSARTIFSVILDHGAVTHADLRQITGMPARTIRYGVRRLKEDGLIDSRCSLRDSRTCYFFVHQQHIDPQAVEHRRRLARNTSGFFVQAMPIPAPEEPAPAPLRTPQR